MDLVSEEQFDLSLVFDDIIGHLKAMSITATVEEGKIILPPGINLPNGTLVRIETVNVEPKTICELLKDFEGIADDLPTDMAENHNHYIHGPPKK